MKNNLKNKHRGQDPFDYFESLKSRFCYVCRKEVVGIKRNSHICFKKHLSDLDYHMAQINRR